MFNAIYFIKKQRFRVLWVERVEPFQGLTLSGFNPVKKLIIVSNTQRLKPVATVPACRQVIVTGPPGPKGNCFV